MHDSHYYNTNVSQVSCQTNLQLLVIMTCIDTAPATPMTDFCAVYDMENKTLQIIESSWNEVVGCVC